MKKKFLDKQGLAEFCKSFKDKFVSKDEFSQKEQEIYSNTSSELTGAFGTLSNQLQNKASKSDVPTKLSQLVNDKNYVDVNKVNELILQASGLKKEVHDSLPTQGKDNILYLVKDSKGKDNNFYFEYLWIDNKFELIGSTDVDLSQYAKKEELESKLDKSQLSDDTKTDDSNKVASSKAINTVRKNLEDKMNKQEDSLFNSVNSSLKNMEGVINELATQFETKIKNIFIPKKLADLEEDETHKVVTQEEKDNWNNKVDKVNGKDLSTNDYTNSDKAKVNAIPSSPKYTDTVTRINGKTGDITKEDLETLNVWVSKKYLYKILFGEYLLTREAGKWAVVHGQPTEVESGAFQHKNLISVYIPNCVKWIGRASFTNNKLTNVTIPESVVHIGSLAFTENPLKEVKVPRNCKVAEDAFDDGVKIIRY